MFLLHNIRACYKRKAAGFVDTGVLSVDSMCLMIVYCKDAKQVLESVFLL